MADSPTDDDDKTEEPSHKKLREARERGQVAQSREVNTWVILFTAALLLSWLGTWMGQSLTVVMREFLERPHAFDMDEKALGKLLTSTSVETFRILGVPLIIFFLAALGATVMQVGFLISGESLKPNLDKINPLKGAKRVFGSKAWIEFIKAFLKMVIVTTITTVILIPIFKDSPHMIGYSPSAMMDTLHDVTKRLLTGILSILFIFAIFDYGVQWFQLNKQLRMSRQELRDEYKQTEGDPHIKARLRELRLQRARKRMMQKVPTADVVITNPTHFAIALEYKAEKNAAPVVVAKGQDNIALKIREIAKENNVPIVENKPLARAMYDNAELDQEIPEEHFKAVAEIISYVFSLKRR